MTDRTKTGYFVIGVAAAAVKLALSSEDIFKDASAVVVDAPSMGALHAGRFTQVSNPGLLQPAGLKTKENCISMNT